MKKPILIWGYAAKDLNGSLAYKSQNHLTIITQMHLRDTLQNALVPSSLRFPVNCPKHGEKLATKPSHLAATLETK